MQPGSAFLIFASLIDSHASGNAGYDAILLADAEEKLSSPTSSLPPLQKAQRWASLLSESEMALLLTTSSLL